MAMWEVQQGSDQTEMNRYYLSQLLKDKNDDALGARKLKPAFVADRHSVSQGKLVVLPVAYVSDASY